MSDAQLEEFKGVATRLVSLVGFPEHGVLASLSAAGFLVTARGARFHSLRATDFVTITDVDPVKGVMLVSGPGEPSSWAGVLSLVLRHRTDAAAAVFAPAQSLQGDGRDRGGAQGDAHDEAEKQEDSPAEVLAGYRLRGWGFDEEAALDLGMGSPTGSMVEWAGWALKGLRGDCVARLPAGHVLAVDENLQQAAAAVVQNPPRNE